MGSIEMTDYERRQLAAQSLETNIRDENFCELFPELTTVKIAIMLLGLFHRFTYLSEHCLGSYASL